VRWTLVQEEEAHPGWQNMALDMALLEQSARHREGYLRLYRWAPHCLSFGRHEPGKRRYDRDAIDALGLDVVRRPTGGRAVWHARELTYTVTAPSAAFGPLQAAYRSIHETLCRALADFGAAASLASPPDRQHGLDAGACFAQPVGGELMVDERKVVGSAQMRRGDTFLQHGSILLDDDQEMVARVTRGDPPPGTETPLNRLLDTPVTATEMADAVAEAARRWSGEWLQDDRGNERAELAAGYAERFRSDDWTWRR
jgi:lipoate-protein ligase A